MPGMLCDAGLWAEVEPALDVTAVHAQLSEPSITGMAEQVLSSTDGPFTLIGLSLGAIVGFEVARLAPERVVGFAALSTNATGPRSDQLRAWRRMAEHSESGEFASVVEETLTAMFATPLPPSRLARAYRGMAGRVGEQRFLAQLAAQATRTDARAGLTAIDAPSLVACGTEDALCPPEFHRDIADRLPDAELHQVPDSGHLLPLEAPEKTAELLNRLLRRCGPAPHDRGDAPCPR